LNKYLKPRNYIRTTGQIASRYLLGNIEPLLCYDIKKSLRHPPIFILGPPRSGSTLAMQVITETFDIGYMSNQHCKWFGAPALAERLFHPTADRPSSDYQSEHGATQGSYAPAECGEWWYRFFRRSATYMPLDDEDPIQMGRFRRSVASITNAFDRSIVFKNLYASLRIQAIANYLPESLFIITYRNEVDNGHSLLEARFKQHKTYEKWLSIEPPTEKNLKSLPPHQQVVEQIREIYKTIDQDLEHSGVSDNRRFNLSYEELCRSPSDTISNLKAFLDANGCSVARRGDPPRAFEPRKQIRIDATIFENLVSYSTQTDR
jgi:hypothetical protein